MPPEQRIAAHNIRQAISTRLPYSGENWLLHLILSLAQLGKPFLAAGRRLFSHKPKLAKKIPPQIAYEAIPVLSVATA